MTFDEYGKTALEFAVYPKRQPTYCALGLCGESGEVAEKLKKILRDKDGKIEDSDREAIAKELSDVMWYLNAMAFELGYSLHDIAEIGIKKLTDRHRRGVLHGSGDDR